MSGRTSLLPLDGVGVSVIVNVEAALTVGALRGADPPFIGGLVPSLLDAESPFTDEFCPFELLILNS